MSDLPSIDVLETVSPSNIGRGDQRLSYDMLMDNVAKYRKSHAVRSAAVAKLDPNTIEGEDAVRQLIMEGLVDSSARLVTSPDGSEQQGTWAKRFTQASIRLYGRPDKYEVARLLQGELAFLHQIDGSEDFNQDCVSLLGTVYEDALAGLAEVPPVRRDSDFVPVAVKEFGEVLRERYGYIFDLVDDSKKKEYAPKDLSALIQSALDRLSIVDGGGWKNWHTQLMPKSTIVSVDTTQELVRIGENRPVATKQEAKALLAHELLVHVLRSKNGYAKNDEKLAVGIGSYLDVEEGLGLLAEYATTGDMPARAYDRYVDIALALGLLDGRQYGRQELFHISYARQLLRLQAQYKFDLIDQSDLDIRVWSHIDRIFRGTAGDSSGKVQAVFTKDVAYYKGYREISDYLAYQVEEGHNMADVFDYIMQGKFDPTDEKHREYVASHGSKRDNPG